MNDVNFSLSNKQRSSILSSLFTLLREHYVFPDIAENVVQALSERLKNGQYDDCTSIDVFSEVITEHMYELSDDRHLCLFHQAEAQSLYEGKNLYQDTQWQEIYFQEAIAQNFGFQKVERLVGNIGYFELSSFFPPEFAGNTAIAVMAVLAHTNALIVDLRNNDGGENYMAHLLCSYFFQSEPILLNSFYMRSQKNIQQCWTLPYIPGKRYLDKPVYVLTGIQTASAAEEFAYTLQQLKRATIVGAKTIGAANPIERYQITPHLGAFIPIGQAINAITGTNWESTGVIPDIEVPQDTALKVAHLDAIQKVLEAMSKNASSTAYKSFEQDARMFIKDIVQETN